MDQELEIDTRKVIRETLETEGCLTFLLAFLIGWPLGALISLLPSPLKRRVRQGMIKKYQKYFPDDVRIKSKYTRTKGMHQDQYDNFAKIMTAAGWELISLGLIGYPYFIKTFFPAITEGEIRAEIASLTDVEIHNLNIVSVRDDAVATIIFRLRYE